MTVAEKTSAPHLALAYVPLELSFYSESAIVLRTMLGVLAMLKHRLDSKAIAFTVSVTHSWRACRARPMVADSARTA
jgi:hypothetical protein